MRSGVIPGFFSKYTDLYNLPTCSHYELKKLKLQIDSIDVAKTAFFAAEDTLLELTGYRSTLERIPWLHNKLACALSDDEAEIVNQYILSNPVYGGGFLQLDRSCC